MKNKLILIVLFLYSFIASATEYSLTYPVNDYAKLLTQDQQNNLNARLMDEYKKTNTQIAILTIESLEGEPIENFSIRMVEKYKLGLKGADNGVLFILSIKDRKTRIEVGRGFEGTLTDLKSARILNEVKPFLRSKDYNGGINFIVDQILNIVKSDLTQLEQTKKETGSVVGNSKEKSDNRELSLFFLMFLIVSAISGYIYLIDKLILKDKFNKEAIKTVQPALTLYYKNQQLLKQTNEMVGLEKNANNYYVDLLNIKRTISNNLYSEENRLKDVSSKLELASRELNKIKSENDKIKKDPDSIVDFDLRGFEKTELLTFLVKHK